MNPGNEFLAGLVRARWTVAACCSLLLFAGGCASNVLVNLRPYEPQAGNPTGSLAKIRIEPVKDARGDAVGSMIGERTTIGNVSMGGIEMNPLPTDVMGRVLKTEFAQMGYAVVSAAEQFAIGARLRKFQVLTPATALYWDINGAIELEVAVTAQDGRKHDAGYAATCTERTYVWPSEDIIGSVVSACVGNIGTKVRGDAALARFIGER
jgi:uncharacterized lipoprotein YajG